MLLDHLHTLAQSVKQLPESTWLETAAKSWKLCKGWQFGMNRLKVLSKNRDVPCPRTVRVCPRFTAFVYALQ